MRVNLEKRRRRILPPNPSVGVSWVPMLKVGLGEVFNFSVPSFPPSFRCINSLDCIEKQAYFSQKNVLFFSSYILTVLSLFRVYHVFKRRKQFKVIFSSNVFTIKSNPKTRTYKLPE